MGTSSAGGTSKRAATSSAVLLRYRPQDTAFGVSRSTTAKLAKTLGLTETQVIHVALARFARETLPRYEMDDGPLTKAHEKAIEKLVPQGRMKAAQSLF
ncbi:MAG: hypothetical protein ACKVQK_20065 [Burkholderiales bacterium]